MMIIQIYRVVLCLNSFSAERHKMRNFPYSAEETQGNSVIWLKILTSTSIITVSVSQGVDIYVSVHYLVLTRKQAI